MELQLRLQEANIKAETEIQKALIMADSFNAKEGDADADGVAESDEIYNRYMDRLNEVRDRYRNANQDQNINRLEQQKMQLAKEKMKTDIEIAKTNKNKYDQPRKH